MGRPGLRVVFVLTLLVLAGCAGSKVAGPRPPSPPRSELSWRERVRRAVDSLGDRCYPGRQFDLDPARTSAVSAASAGSSRSDTPAASGGRRRAVTAASDLDFLADIEFARFRKDTSELVLIGPPAEPGNGILPEDWLTVLRGIRGPEAPGVTIDPGPNPNLMQVRYFGGIERTSLGDTFFEADRTLKLLSTGFDNYNCQVWQGRPPGIPTEMDLYSQELWSANSNSAREGWHRYWFEPNSEPLETEETAAAFTLKIPVNRLVVNDESIPPGRTSLSSREFAEAVTKNFLDATIKVPSFRSLQSAAALVEIAKWMQDKQIPVDQSWLGESIPPVATAETTPSITVLRAALRDQVYLRFGIHGGVDFQKENTYRPASFINDPVQNAAGKSEPRAGSRWDFAIGNLKYRAVKMKIDHPASLSMPRTRWVRFTDALAQPGVYRLVFPESKLQILNAGLSPLSVKLRGPIDKDLSVSGTSETFTVLPGAYEISVTSGRCLPRTDRFTVNEGESFRLQFACVPPPRVPEGSYIVVNLTGAPVELTISGPSSGTHQVPPGTSTIPLMPGNYTVHVSATCGQTNETFVLVDGDRYTGTYTCRTYVR